MDLASSILQEALLVVTTMAVISLTAKEFGLYNLAAGLWITLSGWIVPYLMAPPTPGAQSQPGLLICTLAMTLVQPLAVFTLRNRLSQSTLPYLLITLGVQLAAANVATRWVLPSATASIPTPEMTPTVFCVICLFLIGAVTFVSKSTFFAKLIVTYRAESADTSFWSKLALLVLAEQVGLLILGALSYGIHNGIIHSSEFRTLLPVLALVAAGGKQLLAAAIAFGLYVGSNVTIHFGFRELSQYPGLSRSVAIAILLAAIILTGRPKRPNGRAAQTQQIPSRRLDTGALTGDRFYLALATAPLYLLLSTIALALAAANLSMGLTPTDLSAALRFVTILTTAWFAGVYLSVFSICWPLYSLAPIYAISIWHHSPLFLGLSLIAVLLMATLHLLAIRLLPHEGALLLDLGLLALAHTLIKALPALSGENEVLTLPESLNLFVDLPYMVISLQLFLAVFLFYVAFFLGSIAVLRARVLALANFNLGELNGFRPRSLFCLAALTLIGLASLSSYLHHMTSNAITTQLLQPEWGLAAMIIAYFMQRKYALSFIPTIVFCCLTALTATMTGEGTLLPMILGASLTFVGFFGRGLR